MEIHAKNIDISLYVDVPAGDDWVQNRNCEQWRCYLERYAGTQYAIFLEGTLNSDGHTLAITENWYFCCILESARDFCTAREG